MTYEFHPDALAELEQAAHYYGAREAGWDLRFQVRAILIKEP